MRPRLSPRRLGPLAAACGAAALLVASSPGAQAQAPSAAPAPASPVPVSATSQCVAGPGAPPADPTKVTRVVPGQPSAALASSSLASSSSSSPSSAAAPPEEPSLDDPPAPGAPPRVLLEAGLFAGVSARFDDPPFLQATRRFGPVLGGSLFVWPSRLLSFGAAYAHVTLDRVESPPTSLDAITIDHEAHTLLAEARVVPLRFSSVALYAAIAGGLAWQGASLRAAFVPVNGSPAASITCSAGSDAELAFRAALGMKARVGRAVSVLLDASFLGYRLSAEVLDNCAAGAGTAQTLMVRAGLTYDIDITRLVR